jgi:gas vesicle protein
MDSENKINIVNLDSLIDTLSNVVGILILLAILAIVAYKTHGIVINKKEAQELREAAAQMRESLNDWNGKWREIKTTVPENEKERVKLTSLIAKGKKKSDELRDKLNKIPDGAGKSIEALKREIANLEKGIKNLNKEMVEQEHARDGTVKEVQSRPPSSTPKDKGAVTKIEENIATAEKKLLDLTEGQNGDYTETQVIELPDPSSSPKEKNPEFFVCRRGRVFPLDEDILELRISFECNNLGVKSESFRQGDLKKPIFRVQQEEYSKLIQHFQENQIGNGYLNVVAEVGTFFGLQRLQFKLVPKGDQVGETFEKIAQPDSIFQKRISGMDFEKRYALFLVWDDSFDVYCQASVMVQRHLEKTKKTCHHVIGWNVQSREDVWRFKTFQAVDRVELKRLNLDPRNLPQR